MNIDQSIQDVMLWKKEEMEGTRERIRIAIRETKAHNLMKDLLLQNTNNGGKMLRPLLMFMAAEDYKESMKEELLWGAAAGEMVHTASLYLDDIIDDAPLRRGEPSVYAKHGVSAAICAGTFLMSTAYSCLLERGFTNTASDLLHVTQLVCDGELLQDMNRFNTDVSEEIYIQSIQGKTAVVFSFCAEVASRISGHDEKTQKLMKDFGLCVGTIFQLRDDILDWTKTEKELGKPACEDFTNGIYTLPAIFAFRQKEYGEELLALTKKTLTTEELEKAKDLVIRAGGIEYAKKAIKKEAKKAAELLDQLPSNPYTDVCRMIINSLT
ncbi:MAG: polyprenyl synthetase family protein [Lachnospiraceae bacterium]|nr:polyprenyl synthetase family protein [Lachnospiraceae bacterium]